MEHLSLELFVWILTVAALVVLLFYNSIIYFYSRIKSFLFYAIYNFFLVIYIGSKTDLYSLYPGLEVANQDNWYIQIIYNLAYLQFFRHFLDLKDFNPSLDKLLERFLYFFLSLSTILFIGTIIASRLDIFHYFFLCIFLPCILILAVYSIVSVMRFQNNLKYYVVFGVSLYIIMGLIALYFSEKRVLLFGRDPMIYFYFGVLMENSLFSMGLGHKIKIISDERMAAKQMLIEQLQENDKIKEKINKSLEQEVKIKTEELIKALKEKEQEKIERIHVEYEQKITELNLVSLRNQMNPHFIFNALNAIKFSIISEKKKDAISYLNKFSKLLREILKLPDEGYTLEQELNTLKLYINLENIRLSEKVKFTLSIDKKTAPQEYQIPAMLLQPLVENAIWHGLSGVKNRQKEIKIRITRPDAPFLFIGIEDNGIGLKEAERIKEQKVYLRDSLGIKLVEDRLKLFAQQMDSTYSLKYIRLEDETPPSNGTRVEIELPMGKI